MPGEQKKTEEPKEVEPQLSAADKEVLDYAAAEEAEADRIFNEMNGIKPDETKEPVKEEPKVAVKEEPKVEVKEPVVEVPKEAVKPDETKGLNPGTDDDLAAGLTVENAKKRISAAQNKMHESNKMAKTSTEEATRLVKENADLKALIEQAATTPEEKPPEKKVEKPTETDDEIEANIEAIKTEYPEIGAPMLELLRRQQTQNKYLTDKLDSIEVREQKREADAKTLADNTHLSAIHKAHPDYKEISVEPLFDEWIDGLPAIERVGAQAIRKDGDTSDVIDLLTTFKKANGYTAPDVVEEEPKPATVDSKLDKARKMATPSFKKTKEVNIADKKVKFTQSQIAGWTEKEWAENEAAVDAAMAEGLVV